MTKTTTAIPTFAQQLAAIAALADAERPLGQAHTAAEVAVMAFEGSKDSAAFKALQATEDATEDAWMKAVDATDAARLRLLQIPTLDRADLATKLEIVNAAVRDDLPFAQVTIKSVIDALGAPSPNSPATAPKTPITALCDDARFLAWDNEREALWQRGNVAASDDARDAILADHHKVQRLIFETPSASLTAARVKASTLEQHARFDLQGHEVPLAEIVAALRAAGAR